MVGENGRGEGRGGGHSYHMRECILTQFMLLNRLLNFKTQIEMTKFKSYSSSKTIDLLKCS